jgi:hypothetical protein
MKPYYCTKCKHWHLRDSSIAKAHREYEGRDPAWDSANPFQLRQQEPRPFMTAAKPKHNWIPIFAITELACYECTKCHETRPSNWRKEA